MSVAMAIVLGLVQGITEFLPVSSSGHLSIIQNLFNFQYVEEEHLLFDVLLHIGTLGAVLIVYKKEIGAIITDCAAAVRDSSSATNVDGRFNPNVRKLFLIVVGTLPLFVAALFNSKIETLFYNTGFIAFALIMTGILLIVASRIEPGRKTEKTATISDALFVGVGQAIAVIPGLSRSGTTITVALACGFKRSFAAEFSFLLSVPAVLGSAVLTLFSAVSAGIVWSDLPAYIIGMAVAFLVGYCALSWLKRALSKMPLTYFGYYCVAAGFLSFIISLFIK